MLIVLLVSKRSDLLRHCRLVRGRILTLLQGFIPISCSNNVAFTIGPAWFLAGGKRQGVVDSPFNPKWVRFLEIVNGKALHLKYSGDDFWRVDAP
jgi:hypothetical protein